MVFLHNAFSNKTSQSSKVNKKNGLHRCIWTISNKHSVPIYQLIVRYLIQTQISLKDNKEKFHKYL